MIAVKACGVNYPDLLIIEDRYQFKPQRPFAPGGEVAGVVEAVGEGVTGIKVGDRVIGSTISGGMSEKLAVEAARCTPMPANMPFDEASALILTYGDLDPRAEGPRQAQEGRDACWCWAPRAASASRRSSSARPMARG